MGFWAKAAAGAAAVGAALGAAAIVRDGNRRLVTSSYTLVDSSLPEAFHGLKIVHLSDLHGTRFGKRQADLLRIIDNLDADVALITGDLIDRRRTNSDKDMEPALELLTELAKRMPTIRVDGNHEPRSPLSSRFAYLASCTGAQNITGRTLTLKKNGEELVLIGVPDMVCYDLQESVWAVHMFCQVIPHRDRCCLMLSHRPQFLDYYQSASVPFVLCGHAHGGQFRLPFVGPLYAPEQGVFPQYTAGVYRRGTTQMVVSRGLGNSGFPVRFGNHPEIVTVTLRNRD